MTDPFSRFRAGVIALVVVFNALPSAAQVASPSPERTTGLSPVPTPPQAEESARPPAGFAEAPEPPADPSRPTSLPPPPDYIHDPGHLLDPARRSKLTEYLESRQAETGIRIYLAAFPTLRDEAPSTRAIELQSAWVQNGLGGVLVYGGDSRRFGISVTRKAIELLPPGTIQAVIEQCERNLRTTRNVALVLREGVMDLEFELRSALAESRKRSQRLAPWRIAAITSGAAVLLLGSVWVLHQLWIQNLFGRSHRFIRRPDVTPRFGGLCSGGHCGIARFDDHA